MSNIEVPEQFMSVGGTEYAPMSTTADVQVALHYSGRSPSRLLRKGRGPSGLRVAVGFLSPNSY